MKRRAANATAALSTFSGGGAAARLIDATYPLWYEISLCIVRQAAEGALIFPKKKPPETPLFSGSIARASVVGLHLVSGMLTGGAIGYFLWQRFDAAWWFWIFLALGFVAGCLNTYREAQKLLRDQDATNDRKNPPRD